MIFVPISISYQYYLKELEDKIKKHKERNYTRFSNIQNIILWLINIA